MQWFRSIGVPPDPKILATSAASGPKLYGLSGHVNQPGCYEAPLGITCRQAIDEFGGGVWKGRKAKAVVPGGLSTGVMTADEFDLPLDFAGPLKAGCLGLGTACLIVLDETYPMFDFLYNSCRFFAHESCGQCTPCREGTHWSLMILDRIKAGRGRLMDLDLLAEIGDTIGIIPGTTICGLADGAAWPIKTTIRKFRGELEEYIQRTNPAGMRAPSRRGLDGRLRRMRTDSRKRLITNQLINYAQSHHRRTRIDCPTGGGSTPSRRPARRHRDPALLLPPGTDGRGQLPHVPGRVGNRDAKTGEIKMQPKLVPGCTVPASTDW